MGRHRRNVMTSEETSLPPYFDLVGAMWIPFWNQYNGGKEIGRGKMDLLEG
jgi:hypothetical protein